MANYANIDSFVAGLETRTNNIGISKVGAEDINFGEAVVGYKGDKKLYKFRIDGGKLVMSADFVASNSIVVMVNGVATTAVVYATSHANTATLVMNAIKALVGVECVLNSSDSTNRTYLIRTKGATAVVSVAVTLGASQATGTFTGSAASFLRGIASFQQIEGGKYASKTVVDAVERGGIAVPVAGAISCNMPAYLNTSGVFATSGTAVSGAMFDSNTTGAGLAELVLNGPVALSAIADSF